MTYPRDQPTLVIVPVVAMAPGVIMPVAVSMLAVCVVAAVLVVPGLVAMGRAVIMPCVVTVLVSRIVIVVGGLIVLVDRLVLGVMAMIVVMIVAGWDGRTLISGHAIIVPAPAAIRECVETRIVRFADANRR